jgi:4-hydroxyphenylpyruvate dioxygenase
VQHIAVKTNDIFATLREMMQRRYLGGFEFVPRPSDSYYRNLHARIGDALTEEQYKQCEELGVLVDKDDLGVLLQIFTRPVCDRATVFFEIIQRVGCMDKVDEQKAAEALLPDGEKLDMQVGGCGGFGKGNFAELFKSIEDYERLLDGSAKLNEKGSIEIVSGM